MNITYNTEELRVLRDPREYLRSPPIQLLLVSVSGVDLRVSFYALHKITWWNRFSAFWCCSVFLSIHKNMERKWTTMNHSEWAELMQFGRRLKRRVLFWFGPVPYRPSQVNYILFRSRCYKHGSTSSVEHLKPTIPHLHTSFSMLKA